LQFEDEGRTIIETQRMNWLSDEEAVLSVLGIRLPFFHVYFIDSLLISNCPVFLLSFLVLLVTLL
jgi:hypothetical protein